MAARLVFLQEIVMKSVASRQPLAAAPLGSAPVFEIMSCLSWPVTEHSLYPRAWFLMLQWRSTQWVIVMPVILTGWYNTFSGLHYNWDSSNKSSFLSPRFSQMWELASCLKDFPCTSCSLSSLSIIGVSLKPTTPFTCEGHLGGFYFLAVRNKTALNICVQMFFCLFGLFFGDMLLFYSGSYLEWNCWVRGYVYAELQQKLPSCFPQRLYSSPLPLAIWQLPLFHIPNGAWYCHIKKLF